MASPAAWLYWTLVVVLIGVGALGIFSIGLPLLVLGFVLAALYPVRRRVEAFWPPIVAVIAFFAGWWLIGPTSCSTEARPTRVPIERPTAGSPASAPTVDGRTTCTSLLGITYAGEPFWIGPLAGLGLAAVAGLGGYAGLRRLGSRRA